MIKDIINENEKVTPNSKEIEILKENFPYCFRNDGTFDIERFKEFLNTKIDIANEGYELKFLGKNYARLLASLDTTTVIVPDEEHNKSAENANSNNFYISGDNLDALKHLIKSYSGQVDCIYIDPPYNTGQDGFVYNDNFTFSVQELSEKLSVDEDQAMRILDLTKRGSASHSAWLMFMYPRILLARDVLAEEGVIFVSIDENESSNLRLLMDDVFGEENYIAELTWEKKKKGSYLANSVTNIKETVTVYAKKKEKFSGLIGEINRKTETYPCVNASNGRDVRTIPAGIISKYRKKNFSMKKGEVISDTTMNLVLHSDLVIKDGILDQELVIEGNWRYGQDAMTEYANNKEIYITQDLYLRRIVSEPRKKGLKDLLTRVGDSNESGYSYDFDFENLQKTGWGSNEDADEELRLLLGEQSLMSYPKPVLLIMKLIASLQKDRLTVLDFFSGSATTAEAVLRLNARGKDYNYIMVQLPENLDDRILTASGEEKKNLEKLIDFLDSCNAPHTLDWLGVQRIMRAEDSIKENPKVSSNNGFKHFTLSEANTATIDKLEKFDPADNGFIITNGVLEEFGESTVLTTWLVRDGYGFNPDVMEVDFAGYPGYYVGKHLYLIKPNLSNDAIAAITDKYEIDGSFNPENIVLFGYSFTWAELETLKINLARLREEEKNLRINYDVRY